MGIAGRIAQAFLRSKLTPLVTAASLLVGALALVATPREEEPQISVPMIDILVARPGASPTEVERALVSPIEQLVAEIPGVEYTYAMAGDGQGLVTARFRVGADMQSSADAIHAKLASAMDRLPPGQRPPLVQPHGIDDVPVLALTLTAERTDAVTLRQLALRLQERIRSVPEVAQVTVTGGARRTVRVVLDPARLAASGLTAGEVAAILPGAEARVQAGETVRGDAAARVDAVASLADAAAVGAIVVGAPRGTPVRLRDVATVTDGADEPIDYVSHGEKGAGAVPAVVLAVAKRGGANATTVTREVRALVDGARGTLLPSDVQVHVTRDHGRTAKEKADTLIEHLLLATVSVTLLVWWALGWREALVVLVAVPVTLALTTRSWWSRTSIATSRAGPRIRRSPPSRRSTKWAIRRSSRPSR